MKKTPAHLVFTAIIYFLITSCTSNEIGNSKDVNPETIYTGYSINAREADDTVTCTAYFRFAGENGTTLVLTKPAAITLDGKKLDVDSSAFAGAYYEYGTSLQNFTGNHQLEYTDINGKKYNEAFSFQVLALKNNLPPLITKKGINIEFNGTTNGDAVFYEISDTSSVTNDVIVTDTIRNNSISLKAKDLQTLSSGPVTFKLYQNKTIPLQNATKEGGIIKVSYSLKQRETVLSDE